MDIWGLTQLFKAEKIFIFLVTLKKQTNRINLFKEEINLKLQAFKMEYYLIVPKVKSAKVEVLF